MIQDATLNIRLTRGTLTPRAGQLSVNQLSGGPETLLRWLETQLGLPVPAIHIASRITEYAAALDTLPESTITASLKNDRWETTSELLSRRDELLLSGWDETESERLPEVVNDLSRAVKDRTLMFPGEGTRLQRVLAALGSGQLLPSHRCVLYDSPEKWPTLWRSVLAKLTVVDQPTEPLCVRWTPFFGPVGGVS